MITTPDTDNTSTDNFSIEDLNGETFSLDDLATSPLYNIKTSDLSNKQLAVNTALLKEDPQLASQALQEVNKELATGGSSPTQTQIMDDIKSSSLGAVQESLVNVLLDGNTNEDQKRKAVQFALDKTSDMLTMRKQLTTSQLSKEIKGGNAETERVRINFASQIDLVNDQLEEQQHLLNQRVAAVDVSTAGALVELVETMLPFGKQVMISGIIQDLKKQLGEDSMGETGRVKSFLALGEATKDVQDLVRSVPPRERHKITQMLADIIDNNSEIIIPDENGYAKVDLLRTFLEEGYYEDGSLWVDNIIGLLDIVALGGTLKKALNWTAPRVAAVRDMRKLIADSRSKHIVEGNASSTSAGRNLENSNPDAARAAFDASTGEEKVAEAFYGTSSADVAARGINPKPITSSDVVEAMPSQMGKDKNLGLINDPDMLEEVNKSGKLYLDPKEKKVLQSQVFHDFEKATGLVLRENMMRVGIDDSDAFTIKAMYAPNANSGWESVSDAVEQVMFSLRKYGLKEEDVTVMVRSGDKYVPLKSSDNLQTVDDYVVDVNYKYEYNHLDVTSFDSLKSNLNLFDRTIGRLMVGQGVNLSRLIKDPASLFDPKVYKGAFRAEDRSAAIEKKMVELSKDFDKMYMKLPSDKQKGLHEYIKEANRDNLKFNERELRGKGFSQEEVDTLREWKKYWDTMYVLENSDFTRKLSAQGWQLWNKGDDSLIARPIARNQVGEGRTFYDSSQGKVVYYSDDELNDLYSAKADGITGTIVELKTAIDVDGKIIDKMIVPQNSDSFTRRMRDSDHMLNYRDGYYTVKYDNPWFIDKEFLDEAGNVVRKETIATAGSQVDATRYLKRATSVEDNVRFIVRADRNSSRTIEDDYIEVAISTGRTPQRFRGKRLRDSDGVVDASEKHIKDPVQSMIESARNISNRVSYRDYLETTKARFMQNYSDVLPKTYGKATYPTSLESIGKGVDVSKRHEVQDAKQMWEYLNYLENGYINGMDDTYKYLLREISDTVGAYKSAYSSKRVASGEEEVAGAIEKGLLWLGNKNPVGLSKNLAFQAYLATNPIRQFLVQAHQAIQLVALEPTFAVQSLSKQTIGIVQYKLGNKNIAAKAFGVSREEMDAIVKAFDDSGLVANVDRHALIQGSLTKLADSWSVGSKTKRLVSKGASMPRKLGFDAGENVNMMTAWLTMRHRAIQAGKDISRTDVQAEVAALARDFTYGMNFAGDMPYNQNTLSLFLQFMQAPHKAILQLTSNQSLTKLEKARLASYSLVNYTFPPAVMYTAFAPLLSEIEDEGVKDMLVFGMESYILNTGLSAITGEETRIDFSSFSPLDMYGFYEVLTEAWTGGVGEALSNTASVSLLLGHNPRMKDAFMGAARYFNLIEDETETPEDFLKVVEGFVSISSGYSNYMKWSYANEVGKKMSSTGKLSHTTKAATLFTLAGFPTQEESKGYVFGKLAYEKSKDFEDDFNTWYGENKRILAKQGISNQDSAFQARMINNGLLHWNQHPTKFRELLLKKLAQDGKSKDFSLFQSATRLTGITSAAEFRNLIQSAPIPEQQKREWMKTMDLAEKINKEGGN